MGRTEDFAQDALDWGSEGVTGHERFRSLKVVALELAQEVDRLTDAVLELAGEVPMDLSVDVPAAIEAAKRDRENPEPTTAEIEAELDQREAEVSAVLQGEDIVDLEDVVDEIEDEEDLAEEGEITEEEAAKLLGEDL